MRSMFAVALLLAVALVAHVVVASDPPDARKKFTQAGRAPSQAIQSLQGALNLNPGRLGGGGGGFRQRTAQVPQAGAAPSPRTGDGADPSSTVADPTKASAARKAPLPKAPSPNKYPSNLGMSIKVPSAAKVPSAPLEKQSKFVKARQTQSELGTKATLVKRPLGATRKPSPTVETPVAEALSGKPLTSLTKDRPLGPRKRRPPTRPGLTARNAAAAGSGGSDQAVDGDGDQAVDGDNDKPAVVGGEQPAGGDDEDKEPLSTTTTAVPSPSDEMSRGPSKPSGDEAAPAKKGRLSTMFGGVTRGLSFGKKAPKVNKNNARV